MRNYLVFAVVAVLLIAAAGIYNLSSNPKVIERNVNSAGDIAKKMTITTPAFEDNQYMHERYTCDGAGINPELHFGEVPKDAKSLVLIMDDPDAPMGTFTHWLLWNINPETRLIKEGARPAGAVEGKNSAGKIGYMGPCPPSGTHHYRFKLFALNSALSVSGGIGQAELESRIGGMVLESAELTGLYKRSSIPR